MSGIASATGRGFAGTHDRRVSSSFEFWPGWLFHAPIVAWWIALGLRHGAMSLPTAANPGIELGGLCGESKGAILDQVMGPERAVLARYGCFTVQGAAAADRAAAARVIDAAALAWPLVVKPDIGCNGTGVRLVEDAAALDAYLAAFPRGARVMLQEYLAEPVEAGIFYIRHPAEAFGRITSLTLKHAPLVTGDGVRSLEQLVLADPRAARIAQVYLRRLGARRHSVPEAGSRVPLVFVGNHCKGAIFTDGAADITPALTARIERLARALPQFHFGRLDLRFPSVAALRAGTGLRVIEINGVGSEATHIWDPDTSLLEAYRVQFAHYRAAFIIGAAMRRRGARPAGIRAMYRLWRAQSRLLGHYPSHD